ncbi:hypothetical protein [Nocardia caishijiensis]|uniref:Dipeptidase n=1 Tax=Nocardia caishijiensis TaxID=184756 RepID=A0ABQ6YHT7_9NOCA|nr:hypothetical protein [Nocardia caishijiensis]KAF0845271.1 hypothetical protein FNL39_10879 [Nocardia caishijiensis]
MVSTRAGRIVVDEAGGVGWFAHRAAALPAAELRVSTGVSIAIDPLAPTDPLGWSVDPRTDPTALAEVFAEPALAALVARLRVDGVSVAHFDCPTLPAAWAHRAHVAAVARWTLRPLDSGALLLDEALAEHRCGRDAVARRLFGHGAYVLPSLGEQAVEGELSSAATDLLRDAVAVATELGLGEDIVDLAEQLAGIDDVRLSAALAEWRAADESALIGAGPFAHDRVAPVDDVEYAMVDPTVVPPRILAWPGPARPEIRIDYRAADRTYELRSRLAAGVDPWCAEAAELLAYTTEEATGRLLGVAPVEARTDGGLYAELPEVGDQPRGARSFGLFSAETAPEHLRGSLFGRTGIEVDRELLEGWNLHRAAAARLSIAGDNHFPAEVTELLMAAETAVGNARAQMDDLLLTDHPDSVSRVLRARLDAIEAYLELLSGGDPAPGAVLLCELTGPTDER